MTDLRACPFCASANLMRGHGSSILCVECGAQGPRVDPRSIPRGGGVWGEKKALAWNKREGAAAADRLLKLAKDIAGAFTCGCTDEHGDDVDPKTCACGGDGAGRFRDESRGCWRCQAETALAAAGAAS